MTTEVDNKMPDAHFDSLGDLEYSYWWHQNRVRLAQSLLKGRATGASRYLDLGCGTGGFSDQFGKGIGASSIVGIEASPAGIEACREKGMEVFDYDLMNPFTIEGDPFDIVTAMDVLEHLPAEGPALENAFRHLRPGGWFLASVPAYQFLWSSWDEHLEHFRRYTTGRMRKAMADSGLHIRRLSYAFSYALPPAMLRRLAGGGYSEDSCVFPPVRPALNGLLKTLGGWEAGWLRCLPLPFGLSVYVLAQKPEATS